MKVRMISVAALTACLLCAVAATAATLTVNTCAMGAGGSLDTLVAAAVDGDTINFSVNCSGASAIPFTTDLVIKDKGLTIDGTGHTIELNGQWAGVYGGPLGQPTGGSSLFQVFTNSATLHYAVNFTNLTFMNGNGFATGGPAGAINNTRDIVTITNCTFTGNVGNDGGAVFAQNGSTTNITGSLFTGNVSPGIPSLNSGIGAAIDNVGILTITNSTFQGNHITGTGNGAGGAIFNFSIIGATATIRACTITGNTAATGGGLSGNATVSNSIIYGNTATTGPDANGTFTSDGTNLIGVTAPGFGGTDIIGSDPLLGTLGSHGGPTQTIPLLPGSPAINAIASGNCQTLADQRGVTRPNATLCDIGAFESQGFSLALTGGNNQTTNINTAFATPLSVSVTASQAGSPWFEPVAGGKVTFTPPASGASAALVTNPATISGGGAASVTATANGIGGGPYNVTASASGAPSNVLFSLTNLAPLAIAPASLPNGTYGQAYSQTVTASGGSGTGYVFTLGSGSLPPGVTLGSGGSVSGTPTSVGTFNFSVHVVDSALGTADKSYSITINPIACVVDSTLDPTDAGHRTLRDAVIAIDAAACISNLITFDATVFPVAGPPKTIILSSGVLTLSHDATIQGPGARVLTVQGNGASSIFVTSLVPTTTTGISGLTLLNGFAATFGGAIFNRGSMTLTGMTIRANNAQNGGGVASSGSLTIAGSTLSGNTASSGGGAIWSNAALVISNSTLVQNSAPSGHAILAAGATADLTNVTIFDNGNGTSGAVVAGITGAVTLANTLLGGNLSPNCSGTIATLGHNLDSDSTCVVNGVNGDLAGSTVPLDLGSFGDHGGPTDTVPLQGGSAAIDAGDIAKCTATPVFALDQRGHPRPVGAGCDIGALEATQHTLGVSVSGPGTVTASGSTPIAGSIASCGASCSALYSGEDGGDFVTLTATAGTGAFLSSWGGDCSASVGAKSTLTMSVDHNCSALFAFLPPTASGGSFSTPFGTALSQTVTFSDPAGGTLTVTVTVPTTHGILVGPNGAGNFTYTPTGAYSGPDSFSFTVTSSVSGLTSAAATVNLTVSAPIAPTAVGGTFTTPFGTALTGVVTITNPPPGALTVTVTAPPAGGILAGPDAAGNFTYTPGPAFYGNDSFSFTVTNSLSGLSSAPATANITVSGPGAPVATAQSVQTVTSNPLVIHLSATLPPGAPGLVHPTAIATLTFAIAGNPTHGTLSAFDPVAGVVTYTPDSGYIGSDSFTFTASYGGQTSAPAAVTILATGGIPTLDPMALVLLSLLLAGVAILRMRS